MQNQARGLVECKIKQKMEEIKKNVNIDDFWPDLLVIMTSVLVGISKLP